MVIILQNSNSATDIQCWSFRLQTCDSAVAILKHQRQLSCRSFTSVEPVLHLSGKQECRQQLTIGELNNNSAVGVCSSLLTKHSQQGISMFKKKKKQGISDRRLLATIICNSLGVIPNSSKLLEIVRYGVVTCLVLFSCIMA